MKWDPATAGAQPTTPTGAEDGTCFFLTPTGIFLYADHLRDCLQTEFCIQEGFLQALIYLECLGHHVALRADWNNASNKRGNDH